MSNSDELISTKVKRKTHKLVTDFKSDAPVRINIDDIYHQCVKLGMPELRRRMIEAGFDEQQPAWTEG